MKSQILKTDEVIINEYYRLHNELGSTQECCDALLIFLQNKSEPWQTILKGLIHCLQGDGLGLFQSYDNRDEYTKAYKTFEKALKQIKNQESLLYLFVERHRIDSLALSCTKNIDEIIPLYDIIINHFKHSKDTAIQSQIATSLLNKSFTLWKNGRIEESMKIEDELIKNFASSDIPDIQITIAKCINNKCNSIERTIEKNNENKDTEILDLRNFLISKYLDTDNDGLKRQVARAMYYNALDSYKKFLIKKTTSKKIENITGEPNESTITDLLNSFNEFINNFIDSNMADVQMYVIGAMETKVSILQELEINDVNTKLSIYTDIAETFKNSNNDTISFSAAAAMKSKAELLSENSSIEDAINVYSDIIETFKNDSGKERSTDCVVSIANFQKEKLKDYLKQKEEKFAEESRIKNIHIRIKELIEFYPENERNLNELVEYVKENKIIPFVGAGLSRFAGYPLWEEFLESMYNKYERIKSKISKSNFKKITCSQKASKLKELLGVGLFEQGIEDSFSENKLKNVDYTLSDQPIYLLPDLFNGLVLTTNFDKLIERVYFDRKKIHIKSFSPSLNDIQKIHNMRNDMWIYKIHGTIDEIDTIILTQEDYKECYKEGSERYKELNRQVNGKNILFLGCSLKEDDEIIPFYKYGKNFAICDCTKENIETKEFELSAKRIRPILFPPNDNFSYLKTILEYIVEKYKNPNINFEKEVTFAKQSMDFDLQSLMEKAKELQIRVAEAQDKLGEMIITGTSKNKCITITMTGKYDIKDFKINGSIENYSKEEIEKFILFAMKSAKKKVDKKIDYVMGKATEGMPMPNDWN